MDETEGCVLMASLGLAALGLGITYTGALHRLFRRGSPALGLVRLGTLLAMAWILFVLLFFADPSVTGVYVLFYLVMGYAAVKMFGQVGAAAWGLRLRVDVGERRNTAAALVIASWTLATGLIFGGSLWGEADPVGDDEGGWWIPVAFFLLGWAVLVVAFLIYRRREGAGLATLLRQERSVRHAWGTASFLVVCAAVLTDAVAGDFWGWRHGLTTFGAIAAMLLVHEAAMRDRSGAEQTTQWAVPASRQRFEAIAYAVIGLAAWGLQRFLDQALRGGG